MRAILLGLALLVALPGCLNEAGSGPEGHTEEVEGAVPAEYADAELPDDVTFRGARSLTGDELSLTAEDFAFAPTVIEAAPGSTVDLTIENPSPSVHTFTSERLGVDVTVAAGDTAEVSLDLPQTGPVPFVCSFHEGSGMAGVFLLETPAAGEPETVTVSDAGRASALADAAGAASEHTAVPLAEALAQAGNVGGVDAPGAVLRADLAALFGEDSYLTALAVEQRLAGRHDAFADAKRALDDSAAELADRLSAIRGFTATQRAAFLAKWQAHTDALIDYADAVESGLDRAKRRPLEEMTRLERDLGLLMEDATDGEIGDVQFTTGLGERSQALREAIEGLAADDPGAPELVRMAAVGTVERVAVPLAEAFAEARDLRGVDSKAAKLREKLVHGFGGHVFLVGLAAERAGDPRHFDAARAAVHANALTIAGTLEASDVVTNQREPFLDRWDAHVAALLDDEDPRAPLDDIAALLAEASGEAANRREVRAWFETYADALTKALSEIS